MQFSQKSSLSFSLPPLPSFKVIFFFFFRSGIGQKADGILICSSRASSWEGSRVSARDGVSLASSSSLGGGFRSSSERLLGQFSWLWMIPQWLVGACFACPPTLKQQFLQIRFLSKLCLTEPFREVTTGSVATKKWWWEPQPDKRQLFVFSKQTCGTVMILFSRLREKNNFSSLLRCSQAPPVQCWIIVITETANI